MKISLSRQRQWLRSAAAAVMAAALVLGMGTAANAQDAEQQQEIEITADRLSTDNQNQVAVFSGNVRAVQGNNVILAETLKIFYKESGAKEASLTPGKDAIRKIEAIGNVDIKMDDKTAKAEKAIYDAASGVLVLTGPDATIQSGKNFVAGETITLYRNENRMTVESPKNRRVKAVFYSGKGGFN